MITSNTDTSLSEVNIPGYGILQGAIDHQRNIAIFRNVPYAKVPERWRPAVKPDSWAGVRDATKQGYTSHIYDICGVKPNRGKKKSVMKDPPKSNAEPRREKLMRFSTPIAHFRPICPQNPSNYPLAKLSPEEVYDIPRKPHPFGLDHDETDCLNLNIFVPLEALKKRASVPVMVWVSCCLTDIHCFSSHLLIPLLFQLDAKL